MKKILILFICLMGLSVKADIFIKDTDTRTIVVEIKKHFFTHNSVDEEVLFLLDLDVRAKTKLSAKTASLQYWVVVTFLNSSEEFEKFKENFHIFNPTLNAYNFRKAFKDFMVRNEIDYIKIMPCLRINDIPNLVELREE